MKNWLHEELTLGFKVILAGHDFPADFRDGDILDLVNLYPDAGSYVLQKHNGVHEIKLFREDSPSNLEKPDIVGCISSFKRSVVGGFDLFLGGESERKYVPKICSGCPHVEIIESAGKVGAYCHTDSGFKKVLPASGCFQGCSDHLTW